MKLDIQVDDERLQRTLADPQLIAAPVTTFLREVSHEAEQVARRGAPGSVARTIQSNVVGLQANVYSTHSAALPIEVGRRAGAKMPPPNVIARWASRKGINVDPFILARGIARRGIKGRFFLRAAIRHAESRLPKHLSDLGDDVEKRWNA